MHLPLRLATVTVALAALTGCASLPSDRGYAETGELIAARRGMAPPGDAGLASAAIAAPDIPTQPVTADQAVRLAFLYNPTIRQEYARLGLGRAELEAARRLSNPSVGYSHLHSRDNGAAQIGRSLSLSFTDLLLLPARQRFASGQLQRLQKDVAAELLNLAKEVEVAWFAAISADQVSSMRELVASSAEHSAALAQRFFDAGNINRLQLDQEYAASAQARIGAVRAVAEALRARSALATLMGLPASANWTLAANLAAPPEADFSADQLLRLALTQRLDLSAVQQEVALHEDLLGVTRRWRWLGAVEAGYNAEHEIDGDVIRGPSLTLELPIFNQGQAAIARAQAELVDARARLDALSYAVHSSVSLNLERLRLARDIAERYRSVLVPRREGIVARSQEQFNFMLIGVFELIVAKQQAYDAYQEYLEAVRDYWTIRAELRQSVGGRLPDDEQALEPSIGVDAVLPSTSAPMMDHSKMDHSKMDHSKMDHSKMAMPPANGGATESPQPASPAPVPNKAQTPGDEHATHDHGDTP
ncbi:MAG: TolC family protein [Xanthomonadales bacterium]|nr:TolC family protein [Xanthomonadales bacterium]MCB9124607.1 TolC family protein [Caldilineaceae bacterium]